MKEKSIQADEIKKKQNYPRYWDIYYAEIPKRVGKQGSIYMGERPVLIASNDINNKFSTSVIVIPFTSKLDKRKLPVHVDIEGYGLERKSTLACEQYIPLEKSDLKYKMGRINDYSTMVKVARAAVTQIAILSAIV